MLPHKPSRTMVNTAIQRAAHHLLDAPPLILDDPIVVGLFPEASPEAVLARRQDLMSPDNMALRATMILRARYTEDRLAEAVARGVDQYVIVAAGLDTFPWRQPEWAQRMRIFALDWPSSLACTAEQIAQRGLPSPANLTGVPIDLEVHDILERLTDAGFDAGRPAFVSAIGIVQYLTMAANRRLLRFAASLRPSSELVISCHPPADVLQGTSASILAIGIERGRQAGEPWLTLWRPHEAIENLRAAGFGHVQYLSSDEAQERYFAGRSDGLRADPSLQMLTGGV